MGAASIGVVMGVAGLAVEMGNAYSQRSILQQVADEAAISAAMAYNATQQQADMIQAATDSATANGVPLANIATLFYASLPQNSANSAVKVTLNQTLPIRLASLIGGGSSLNVSASSLVEMAVGTSGCIVALGTSGITLSGGTSISATGCGVESGGTITVPWGTKISAALVTAAGTISDPGSGITTTPVAGRVTSGVATPTDTIATTTAIASLQSHLAVVQAMPAPSITVPAGTGSMPTSGTIPAAAYTNPGALTSRTLTFAGGATSIAGTLTLQGANTLTLNAGTYTLGGLSQSSYGATTIRILGTVTLNIGGSLAQSGSGGLTIDASAGTLTLNVSGAVSQNSATAMTFPSGTYALGSILSTDSGAVTFGSDLSGNGFEIAGDVNEAGGNGAIIFGTGNVDIKGNLTINSTETPPSGFGAGTVTIGGNLAVSNGVLSAPNGTTLGVGGNVAVSSSGSLNVSAPTSGAEAGIMLYAPVATTVSFQNGSAANQLSGLLYAPKATLSASGGQALNALASANCFELVAATINMSAGSSAASTCPGYGLGGADKVALAQ